MAEHTNELLAEKELAALNKLQVGAGLVDKPQAERLDWMYEQSAAQIKKTEEELMNAPVAGQKDKDIESVKQLQDRTAGSLFLKSATRTNEDMLRKLREDPLFQIRREEQTARDNLMSNPLIAARIRAKEAKAAKKEKKKLKKASKKEKKKVKKAAKKEKKAAKKAAKAAKVAAKGSSSSSSSSDDSSSDVAGPAPDRKRPNGSSAGQDAEEDRPSEVLGPSTTMISKRQQREELIAQRKELALASRGAARRMDEDERQQRLAQMKNDAAAHDRYKDRRIADAERREKEQEAKEEAMRANSDKDYLRDIRKDAYIGNDGTMADRLKSQRHRRQKGLRDNLERD